MLKILRLYFYFMDYYNNLKKEIKIWVTEPILFQEGQIYPHPHISIE